MDRDTEPVGDALHEPHIGLDEVVTGSLTLGDDVVVALQGATLGETKLRCSSGLDRLGEPSFVGGGEERPMVAAEPATAGWS